MNEKYSHKIGIASARTHEWPHFDPLPFPSDKMDSQSLTNEIIDRIQKLRYVYRIKYNKEATRIYIGHAEKVALRNLFYFPAANSLSNIYGLKIYQVLEYSHLYIG